MFRILSPNRQVVTFIVVVVEIYDLLDSTFSLEKTNILTRVIVDIY